MALKKSKKVKVAQAQTLQTGVIETEYGLSIRWRLTSEFKLFITETWKGKEETESHGKTLWGLFNAVTFFENHERSKDTKKEKTVMLGSSYKHMNSSFDSIMRWIDEHSPKQFAVK